LARPTGQCPYCGTSNIVLEDDGTLPKHRIWDTELEMFLDCPYQGPPA